MSSTAQHLYASLSNILLNVLRQNIREHLRNSVQAFLFLTQPHRLAFPVWQPQFTRIVIDAGAGEILRHTGYIVSLSSVFRPKSTTEGKDVIRSKECFHIRDMISLRSPNLPLCELNFQLRLTDLNIKNHRKFPTLE